ncbi:hypothetical protein, partial [Aerococcus mictus]|uniref:hypothetical protein n=1 Tax=Aerococcus mictus TaxID=2976810 RepID=UPI001C656CF5
ARGLVKASSAKYNLNSIDLVYYKIFHVLFAKIIANKKDCDRLTVFSNVLNYSPKENSSLT